jgi:hypothetical protein
MVKNIREQDKLLHLYVYINSCAQLSFETKGIVVTESKAPSAHSADR